MPLASPGRAHLGGLSEAEAADVIVEALAAHALGDPDHPHVARVRDHLSKGEPVEDRVIVDQDACDLDRAVAAVDDLLGRDHALLEARGGRDDLEDAPGLEGVEHGAVGAGPSAGSRRSCSG